MNPENYDKPKDKVLHLSAIKWEGDNETEVSEFAGDSVSFDDDPTPDFVTVKCKDGDYKAYLGDYIVRDNDGTFHVAKFHE